MHSQEALHRCHTIGRTDNRLNEPITGVPIKVAGLHILIYGYWEDDTANYFCLFVYIFTINTYPVDASQTHVL